MAGAIAAAMPSSLCALLPSRSLLLSPFLNLAAVRIELQVPGDDVMVILPFCFAQVRSTTPSVRWSAQ
jgi:hypothetical protein